MLQDLGKWETTVKVVLTDALLKEIAKILVRFECWLDRSYNIVSRCDELVVRSENNDRYSKVAQEWLWNTIRRVAVKKARERGEQKEYIVVLDAGDIDLTGLTAILLEEKQEKEQLELGEIEELIKIRERELEQLKEKAQILKAKQQQGNPRLVL
jgi:hypothetical protein